MTEEMTLSQKLVEFLYSIGLPPMRILQGLITLLVIGVILGVLYYSNFDSFRSTQQPDDDSDTEFVEGDRPTYEFDLTLDQQIDELTFYDPRSQSYVEIYGKLQEQNETIEEIRQRPGITAAQINKIDETQLRNLQILYLRTLRTGASAGPERKAYEDFASKLMSGSDDQQKDFAQFGLIRTAISAFSIKPTETNGQSVVDALNQHQSSFVNTKSRSAVILTMLTQCKQVHPTSEFADVCIETIGKVFGNSTEADIQEMAKEIGESSLFAKLDIPTLEDRIRYQDRTALMDLDKALRVLEAHPEVEVGKWKLLMHSYEASLSTGRFSDFTTGQNIMSELVAKLPDSDQRKTELVDSLSRQKTRAQQLGKKFDISGTTFDKKSIDQSTGEYTVLFLLNRSQQSIQIMKDLRTFRRERGGKIRPVIAFDDKFSERDAKAVDLIPRWIFVANEDTAEKYSQSFPADTFPYVLLIDKEGVVVAGNLSLLQVANRIATLEKERKAAPSQ